MRTSVGAAAGAAQHFAECEFGPGAFKRTLLAVTDRRLFEVGLGLTAGGEQGVAAGRER